MAPSIRRIVTGHDDEGNATVVIDEAEAAFRSTRPGVEAAVLWTTQGFPVDNDGFEDTSTRAAGTTLENGTVFRVVSFGPGASPRFHRTDSIDYAAVISGEIDMELDRGEVIHVRAGDVLIQRGTAHGWMNRGTEPCVIAFALIAAKPVTAGGRVLEAMG